MAMYANGFILLLYCLAKIELFIETARYGEIKKRFNVLSKTPKRFTSNVETFFRVDIYFVFECLLAGVLYVFFQPSIFFIQQVEDVFLGRVAMAFQWENHIAYGSLVTLQRLVEAFTLDRECTGVVVQFTMNEQ